MNIGEKIKTLRKLNGMDQKQLGEALNVSNKTISSWEANRTEPKMEMIEKLCDVFKCKKTDFLNEKDEYSMSLDETEYQLIVDYRSSDDISKKAAERLLAYANKLSEYNKKE